MGAGGKRQVPDGSGERNMQKYCDRSWTRLLPGTYILEGRNITLDGKDANEPLDLTSPADISTLLFQLGL